MIEKQDIISAQNGNEESLEKIIKEFQKNMYHNNHSFFLKGGDKDDLIQEGLIGLIKAIKSFDESKNTCFSTFANLCIKRQMITAIKNHNSDKFKNLNQAILEENGGMDIEENTQYRSPSLNFYSPEDIYLGKELILSLRKYLSENLSSFEKEVFKYLIKEYSYLEIAEILNEKPKKIDNAIQRIKKKINLHLDTF